MGTSDINVHNIELGKSELLEFFWQSSDDNMFIMELNKDNEFVIVDLNPAQLKNFGYPEADFRHQKLVDIFGKEISDLVCARYSKCLETNEPYLYKEDLVVQGKRRYWETLIIPSQSSSNHPARIFGISRELTSMLETQHELRTLNAELEKTVLERTRELERSNQDLKRQACYDQLTELGNRYYFFDYAEKALIVDSKDETKSTSILYMDVDHFKQINDQYGHSIGDKVLIEIANRLKNSIRANDILARFGGEEFVVLLRTSDQDLASNIAKKILSKINGTPFSIENHLIDVTLSIGISTTNTSLVTLDTLLVEGDKALYHAKRNGRNRIEKY